MSAVQERIAVCPEAELEEGKCKTVTAYGKSIALFKHQAQLFAIDDLCPHRGAPLSLGTLKTGTVICPLHRWIFNLSTGVRVGHPEHRTVVYDVTVQDGTIYLGPSRTPEPSKG